LLGINSATCPKARRLEAWSRLSHELDRDKLASMTLHVPFDQVIEKGHQIVEGKIRGRIVVDIPN
jgi:acrylyl-CoA reductase (NADPH)